MENLKGLFCFLLCCFLSIGFWGFTKVSKADEVTFTIPSSGVTFTIPSSGNYTLQFVLGDTDDDLGVSIFTLKDLKLNNSSLLSSNENWQTKGLVSFSQDGTFPMQMSTEGDLYLEWNISGNISGTYNVNHTYNVNQENEVFVSGTANVSLSPVEPKEGNHPEMEEFSSERFFSNLEYTSPSVTEEGDLFVGGYISRSSSEDDFVQNIDGVWGADIASNNTFKGWFFSGEFDDDKDYTYAGSFKGSINGTEISGEITKGSFLKQNPNVADVSEYGGTSGAKVESSVFYAERDAILQFKYELSGEILDGQKDFLLAFLVNKDTGASELILSEGLAGLGLDPDDPILPPVDEISEGDGFVFPEIIVVERDLYWFDPEIAIGYTYEVQDNSFYSVLLPDETSLFANADNLYDLWMYNSTDGWYDTGIDISGGETFVFSDHDFDNVTMFRILGIDVYACLDPDDPTAFVTGLSFVNSGTAQVTQTPITQDVQCVPEPTTSFLVGLGLLGIAMLEYKRRKTN